MPGFVEEVLLAIRKKQPLYIAGGFGGAAHTVALALQGEKPKMLSREYQERQSPDYAATLSFYEKRRHESPTLALPDMNYDLVKAELEKYGVAGLAAANGLSEDENQELFKTGGVDAALFLIMKGLSAIWH